ncbi:MAG: hypothetical protein ABJB73_12185 [Candidatus Nitrosocosmicus sp.]
MHSDVHNPNKNKDYSRISIKKEWDSSPHIFIDDNISHCHIRRKDEHVLLLDFLSRRKEGVLLLSGKRGVGKSSAVFSAIHDTGIKCKNEGTMLLPILINAPTFEIYKSNQKDMENEKTNTKTVINNNNNKTSLKEDLSEFKQIILQNLVRRLYQVLLKEGVALSEKDIRKKGLSKSYLKG